MKKIFALVLILALALGSFAACGGGEEQPEATEPELTVGFIFIGPINDGGYTQAHYEGAVRMKEHFEGRVDFKYIENVNDTDTQASLTAGQNLLDQGCDVIVGASFGFMEALDQLANSGDYDDKYFLHFSGYMANETNFDNFFGSIDEARYLAGMVAGSMTESNKLGYVGAMPYTEVMIGINAYTLGAQSVNPDAEVSVVYIGSWGDPEKELAAAEQLLAEGCDIITQHSDSTGPQLAAQDAGAYAIGYNLANPAAPDAYLTAPIWHHDAYYIHAVENILAGMFAPESYYGTMATGYIALAPMSDLVPAEVQELVKAKEAEMVAGTFAPFSGYIENADGTVLCEEGQSLDRGQIWAIGQLVKGAK